eukprot:3326253-Rhodomonas_salina.1
MVLVDQVSFSPSSFVSLFPSSISLPPSLISPAFLLRHPRPRRHLPSFPPSLLDPALAAQLKGALERWAMTMGGERYCALRLLRSVRYCASVALHLLCAARCYSVRWYGRRGTELAYGATALLWNDRY